MNRHAIATIYVASIAGATIVARHRWLDAREPLVSHALTIPPVHAGRPDSLSEWMSEAEDVLVSNDPFRIVHEPSNVAYRAATDGGPMPGVIGIAPPYRPVLSLKAIVGGPPWQAMLDGLPGQPSGTVVHSGSTFDRLTVRSVTRDSVLIQGPDTSWVLSFRRRP